MILRADITIQAALFQTVSQMYRTLPRGSETLDKYPQIVGPGEHGRLLRTGRTPSPPEPGLAVPSVLGSHLLLNLREAYYKPYGVGNVTTHTLELPTVDRAAKVTGPGSMDTQWAIYPGRVRSSHINTFPIV